MPRFSKCGSCRAALSDGDRHILCVSCQGFNHADPVLSKGGCPECDAMTMSTLQARLATFSVDPAPLLLSSRPRRKKRRSQRAPEVIPVDECTPANSPCASPPESPTSITAGQCPTSPAVQHGFDGHNAEEDSCSLIASESGGWSGSIPDPAPSLQESSGVRASFDAELLRLITKAVEDLGLE